MDQVSDQLREALWDEIKEIASHPEARGALYEDEVDPEFEGLRIGLGIAGFAIFYLPFVDGSGAYVTSIKPWDYDALLVTH